MNMKHLHYIIIILFAGFIGCKGEPEKKTPASFEGPRIAAPADLHRGEDGRMYFQNELSPFTGFMKATFPDGTPRIEFPHTQGILNGRLRFWHPNGQVKTECNYQMGRRHGNWDEWDPKGLHIVQRVFMEGKLMHEEIPEEFARQLAAMASERHKLDQTVWREETAAQQAEDVFVKLWDDLRVAKGKYVPLSRLVFLNITLPVEAKMRAVDWGIREHMLSAGTEALAVDEWRAWLEAWEMKGWRIVETEWHQEKFSLGKESPKSLFKIVIHAQRENHRAIVRGELEVHWGNVDGKFQARELKVLSARVLERKGAAPFNARQEIKIDNANSGLPTIVKDLNGDGLPEILLPGANKVYWNQGGWKFEHAPLFSHYPAVLVAGVAADFNGDGRVDLFGLPEKGQSCLYVADSNGRFTTQPKVARVSVSELEGYSAVTAGDVDGDGDLDLWVMQYKPPYIGGQFPTPYYNANDGYPSYLLLNDGLGNFTEATEGAGLASKRFRRSYSGSLVDLDGDGDLDLINVSDFSGLDLYLNDGKGQFTDITATLGEDRFSFGMSHALGDFNGDGRLDLYMTGMGSTTARRLETMKAGRKEFAGHQARRMKMGYGNRLFLGGKDGFAQAPYNHQVARAGWSWGVTGADFDLDGDRDIFVANGHRSRDSAKDYCTTFWRHDIYSGNSKRDCVLDKFFKGTLDGFVAENELVHNSWNGFEHNVFYLNLPGEGFVNVAFLLGVSHEFDSRAVVAADFDADGRPDLLVTEVRWDAQTKRIRDVVHLIQNAWPTQGNWIGVHLRGGLGRSPLGAVVTVYADQKIRRQWLLSGDSYSAQHPSTLHFGLGTVEAVDSIEVRWPGGRKTLIEKPTLNRYHSAIIK
jgi:hypothetical protein